MHCLARYLFITVVSVLGLGQMIAACGQKGDLYLATEEEIAKQGQDQEKSETDSEAPPGPSTKAQEEAGSGAQAGSGPESQTQVSSTPEIETGEALEGEEDIESAETVPGAGKM